jgi:hypothetical protein
MIMTRMVAAAYAMFALQILTPALARELTTADCNTPVQLRVDLLTDFSSRLITSGETIKLRVYSPVAGRQVSKVIVVLKSGPALEIGEQQLRNIGSGSTLEIPIVVEIGGNAPFRLHLPADSEPTVWAFAYDSGTGGNQNCGSLAFRLNTGKPGAFAIVAGFNYDRYPFQLHYARKDAIDVVRHLISRRGVPAENIWLFTDDVTEGRKLLAEQNVIDPKKPTEVSEVLTKVFDEADSSATIFFYFSGHQYGNPSFGDERFLVLGQSDVNRQDTMLTRSELFKDLTRRQVRTISIVDSCFSGSVQQFPLRVTGPLLSSTGAKVVGTLGSGAVPPLTLPGGAQITSSHGNELSWEFDDRHNGVFTSFLLESATNDPTHDVTVREAFDYADNQTRNYRPKVNVQFVQNPWSDIDSDAGRELWAVARRAAR